MGTVEVAVVEEDRMDFVDYVVEELGFRPLIYTDQGSMLRAMTRRAQSGNMPNVIVSGISNMGGEQESADYLERLLEIMDNHGVPIILHTMIAPMAEGPIDRFVARGGNYIDKPADVNTLQRAIGLAAGKQYDELRAVCPEHRHCMDTVGVPP